MSSPVTTSEAYVYKLCTQTFLSLWSFNNPPGKKGKELCDVLVVCDPYVIIISVKDIRYDKGTEGTEVDFKRWQKKAVKNSFKQIYGAERWLEEQTAIGANAERPLPPLGERKVHRIAVAFGSGGWLPVMSGDFGKGYVHTMTEDSLGIVMGELDTIQDFVHYLDAKESFEGVLLVEGADIELLGYYLGNNRQLDFSGSSRVVIESGTWEEYIKRPEVRQKKELDRVSYAWDRLIESLASESTTPIGNWNSSESDYERALRILAKENRFNRRLLGEALSNYLRIPFGQRPRARFVEALSGVRYVFCSFPNDTDPDDRISELGNRCFVIRHICGDTKGPTDTVVGIGLGEFAKGKGASSDLFFVQFNEWTQKDDELAAEMQKELNLFKGTEIVTSSHTEYPSEEKVVKSQRSRKKRKIGRNSLCPCGSGIKYKKCCG